MRSSSDLAASISLIHCKASMAFFAQTSTRQFTMQLWNSVWSGNFPRCISEEGQLGFIMPHLSASPNTRGMVSHKFETSSVVQTHFLSFPESKLGVLIAMVLRSHCSQFLLFSESSMVLPNFFNHHVIPQNLVEQADNQKTLPGILIVCRVFRGIPASRW